MFGLARTSSVGTAVTPTTHRDLRGRALGCCEVCGARAGFVSAHYRVDEAEGGRATLGNLLYLCDSGASSCRAQILQDSLWARGFGFTVGGTFEPCDVPVLRWSRWTRASQWVLLNNRGGITPTNRRPR
jgi:hypothetical protein